MLSYPGFVLLTHAGASMVSVTAVLIGLSLCLSMYQAPLTAAFNEFFPTRVRYSAVGFGYAVGISVFGGFAPFIATYLLGTTGNIFSPAFMVIGASAITFVVVMLSVPETLGTHLEKVN